MSIWLPIDGWGALVIGGVLLLALFLYGAGSTLEFLGGPEAKIDLLTQDQQEKFRPFVDQQVLFKPDLELKLVGNWSVPQGFCIGFRAGRESVIPFIFVDRGALNNNALCIDGDHCVSQTRLSEMISDEKREFFELSKADLQRLAMSGRFELRDGKHCYPFAEMVGGNINAKSVLGEMR